MLVRINMLRTDFHQDNKRTTVFKFDLPHCSSFPYLSCDNKTIATSLLSLISYLLEPNKQNPSCKHYNERRQNVEI